MLNQLITIRNISIFSFLIPLLSIFANNALAKELGPHVKDVLIVGFNKEADENGKAAIYKSLKAVKHDKLSKLSGNTVLITLPHGTPLEAVIEALKHNPNIRFVEPDYLLTPSAISNDPYIIDPVVTNGTGWDMLSKTSSPANEFGSRAVDAWAQGNTGSSDVIVADINTGIQLDHPDLAANIWVNPYEIAGNGIDDDGNGYVDDVNGYDFGDGDNIPEDGSTGHGTHVAGTIGAVGGNALGVAGMNWSVSIIPLKFAKSSGTTSVSDAIKAVDYLTDLKIRHPELNIVASNNSYGNSSFSQAFLDAINRFGDQGMLFVAGSGNAATNNDVNPHYPASYQCTNGDTRGYDCVISVAAITSTGGLATFAGYGVTSVDIGAPGVSVWSTVPAYVSPSLYQAKSGGSTAAPHVTGALALCKAAALNHGIAFTPKQMIAALTGSAIPLTALQNVTRSGSRLDAGKMSTYCSDANFTSAQCIPPEIPTNLTAKIVSKTVNLTWLDNSSGEWKFQVLRESYDNRTKTYINPVIISELPANTISYQDKPGGGTYRYSIRAYNTNSITGNCYSPYTQPVIAK